MKIVYISQTGNTAKMAKLIKKGIESEGQTAELAHVSDVTLHDIKDDNVIVLGCPACGNESLEEFDMDPFVDSLDGELEGKKVALFGSYGWGGGQWMRLWEDRIREYGGEIIGEGLTINGVPGDDDASCIEYGKQIAKHLCGECVESKVCTLDEKGDPTCWDGFKPLVVFNKVQESDKITSFYMKAEDGSELPKAKPGQYIAIKYKDINGEYSDVRQYTLSMNSNEDYYRISVKSEEKGKVSKGLCSSIDVGGIIESTVPMGVFTLKEGEEPIVLIAGGIGVTPILSMALAAREENRKVKLIYSVSNSNSHSFKKEIEDLAKECSNFEVVTAYTKPLEGDVEGKDYTIGGRLGEEDLTNILPKNGQYYFCGPFEFMKFVYNSLINMKVDGSRINYEMFDTSKTLTN